VAYNDRLNEKEKIVMKIKHRTGTAWLSVFPRVSLQRLSMFWPDPLHRRLHTIYSKSIS